MRDALHNGVGNGAEVIHGSDTSTHSPRSLLVVSTVTVNNRCRRRTSTCTISRPEPTKPVSTASRGSDGFDRAVDGTLGQHDDVTREPHVVSQVMVQDGGQTFVVEQLVVSVEP